MYNVSSSQLCHEVIRLPCIWYVLRSFVFLCGFLSYCFVAFIIYRLYFKHRTPYYAYTFSLAFCNNLVILYNLIITPFECVGKRENKIFASIGKMLEISSQLHIVAISVSRLIAVAFVHDCPNWLKRSDIPLIGLWLGGLSFGVFHTVNLYKEQSFCTLQLLELGVSLSVIMIIFTITMATGYNLWNHKSQLERTASRKITAYKRQLKLFVRCFIQCSFLFFTVVTEIYIVQPLREDTVFHQADFIFVVVGRHIAYTAYFICPPILCLFFDNLVQHAALTKAI